MPATLRAYVSTHGFDTRIRHGGHRLGAGRAEGRDRLGQARQVGRRRRTRAMLGGVCVNTGTIPSKTLREAVLYLTGMSQRELYGASYRVKEKITPADLLSRTQHVIGKEVDVVRNQLMRNRIDADRRQGGSSTRTPSRWKTPPAANAPRSAASTSSSRPAPGPRGRQASSSTRIECSTPTGSST